MVIYLPGIATCGVYAWPAARGWIGALQHLDPARLPATQSAHGIGDASHAPPRGFAGGGLGLFIAAVSARSAELRAAVSRGRLDFLVPRFIELLLAYSLAMAGRLMWIGAASTVTPAAKP